MTVKESAELEAEGLGHAWADSTCRFPDDKQLRNHGFTIHSRPAKGEPLWIKSGVVFKESEALLRV